MYCVPRIHNKDKMHEFREAKENDYKGICSLVRNSDEMFFFHPKGNYPLTVDQLRRLSKDRKELTVVIDKNEIIGFANIYNYKENNNAFIGNVIIKREHRGKGVGKALVLYMLDKALNKYGLPKVRISVFSENTSALLLYSGLGFKPYAVEERENRAGKRVALIHMEVKSS